MKRIFLTLIALLAACGCEQRTRNPHDVTMQRESSEFVLMLAIDVESMKTNPRAYEFVQHAIETYFHDRMGGNDQIIITQLSGSDRPLLWQGNPQHLIEEFPDHEAFQRFLVGTSKPGRRINLGLAESLDYALQTYSVHQGDAKTITLVMSSMLDEHPEDKAADQKLLDALIRYCRRGGMAFYFCDQTRMDYVRDQMKAAGFSWVILECDIFGRPPLPEFE